MWWCLQVLPKPPWNILGRVSHFNSQAFIHYMHQGAVTNGWIGPWSWGNSQEIFIFFWKCWGSWGMRATIKIKRKQFLSVSSLRLIYHVLIWNCTAVLQDMIQYVHVLFFFPIKVNSLATCRFYWRLPSNMTNLVILKVEGTTVLLLLTKSFDCIRHDT